MDAGQQMADCYTEGYARRWQMQPWQVRSVYYSEGTFAKPAISQQVAHHSKVIVFGANLHVLYIQQ